MSSSVLVSLATTLATEAEEHGDPALPVWAVGLIALGILLALLIGTVAFGGGREHS